ncbi:hypothetical protein QW060_24670 [Myroides ceti]|uniref:Uncharacterized protein n=1 Tax=Paenimyroides ceti TaxID=395087 RepID=A0ABT8D2G0_9FLAO|nr:hypothetical protein [Paenimyroides ceti]MDN3710091.1 hypothetical protein [Paenimyroides ceti]
MRKRKENPDLMDIPESDILEMILSLRMDTERFLICMYLNKKVIKK